MDRLKHPEIRPPRTMASPMSVALDVLSFAIESGLMDTAAGLTDRRVIDALDLLHQSGIRTVGEALSLARDRIR